MKNVKEIYQDKHYGRFPLFLSEVNKYGEKFSLMFRGSDPLKRIPLFKQSKYINLDPSLKRGKSVAVSLKSISSPLLLPCVER